MARKNLKSIDPQTHRLIQAEEARQRQVLELIPSENYTSPAVMAAAGSVLTNKYSEGYPGKRYYAGNENIDKVEKLTQERAKKLFGARFANVQPYSGSPANMAVYFGLLSFGDTIMGMSLSHGGHLTHGHPKVTFSGTAYRSVQYGVDKDTERIDFDALERLAKKEKPKLIIAGYSAYPRIVDWRGFKKVANSIGAYLLADIAHIAGLVVAGVHPNPFPWADVVTTTTHKTLRGPRGAIILTNKEELAQKIDRAIFPGLQGGPHDQQTAAIAVCLKEAATPSFRRYGKQIVKNAKAVATQLEKEGFRLVSGGTDNHLVLVDLRGKEVSGSDAQDVLEAAGVVVNKNAVPYDPNPPFRPSGIRLGTPAVTTRGMGEGQMRMIGSWIGRVIGQLQKDKSVEKTVKSETVKQVRGEIKRLTRRFPAPA